MPEGRWPVYRKRKPAASHTSKLLPLAVRTIPVKTAGALEYR
jgi:hypothetical protein